MRRSRRPGAAFFELFQSEFLPALRRGEGVKARETLLGPMANQYAEHRAAVDEVVSLAIAAAKTLEDNAREEMAASMSALVIYALAAFGIAALFFARMSRLITLPMAKVASALERSQPAT